MPQQSRLSRGARERAARFGTIPHPAAKPNHPHHGFGMPGFEGGRGPRVVFPDDKKDPRTVAGGSRVARAGVEPATFHFSGERYYQLSYLAGGWPVAHPATPTGLEPATSAVTGRRANQLRHGANFLTCWLSPARVTLAALPGFGKSGSAPLCNPVQGLRTGVSLASPTGFEPVLPP